ncbi:hypothetical protein JTB14_013457 [Gonioctena quinquepunctata]|nr:hypothetical protein JTB14_013457 [Gonioctena quinquepunctata]
MQTNSGVIEMLAYCVPELDMDLVLDPLICHKCKETLEITYNFKMLCIRSEEWLLKYSHKVNSKVEILEIHQDLLEEKVQERKCETSPTRISPIFNCANCLGCCNKINAPEHHSKVRNEPFTCYHCGDKMEEMRKLTRHLRTHLNETTLVSGRYLRDKSFPCHFCGTKLKTTQGYEKHLTTHQRKAKCKVCGKFFKDLTSLRNHLRGHGSYKTFDCDICRKQFKLQRNYLKHYLEVHSDNTKNMECSESLPGEICELCGETFANKAKLEEHLLTDFETCGNYVREEETSVVLNDSSMLDEDEESDLKTKNRPKKKKNVSQVQCHETEKQTTLRSYRLKSANEKPGDELIPSDAEIDVLN